MDDNSINTLTLISQSNINEETQSCINSFEQRKMNLDSQKKSLDKLIYEFNCRREQLFQHIDEFSKTKKMFITKSNQYFEDHQKIIIDLKDQIKIQKNELEDDENKKEKVQERIRFISLTVGTIKMNIRQMEKVEKEIDNKMKSFQNIIKNGDDVANHFQTKEKRVKQALKLIEGSTNSIEKYENLILKHELNISEYKLKNHEFYENQTEIIEKKNTLLAKDEFYFLSTKKKIDEMKLLISTKYNKDENNRQVSEIEKNKICIEQKIFDISNHFKSLSDRLEDIKDEIKNKIKETQSLQAMTDKSNVAIKKLRSKRIQREKMVQSRYEQMEQLKSKIERKSKYYANKIADSTKSESIVNAEIKKINEDILNEDVKEKEISLQNEILLKEEEQNKKNEIEATKKSVDILDQLQRKIELERNLHNSVLKSSKKIENNSDSSQNSINDELENQIFEIKKDINQLNFKYNRAKQKFLKLQIQFKIIQSNDLNYDDDMCYKEIEKRIADGRLLYLQRIVELSSNNKEIEFQVEQKLEKIENLKNKINNLKYDEVNKNNLIVAHSSLDQKHISYQNDSVSRLEMISWLYLMIQKEKDEWLKFQSSITINGLLQVWNNFLSRM